MGDTDSRATPPSGRVRITDVAAAAGVSAATVSRVMNGRTTVDPAIRDRVKEVARALRYQPNAIGRSLVLGRTETVGVVVPDLANPSFQVLMRGLSREAGKDGYRILFADTSETVEEEPILAREMRRRCDGLIMVAPRMDAEELADLLSAAGPVVLYNRLGEGGVAIDYGTGIRELCDHLFQLGHRAFAFVAGPSASVSNTLRTDELARFAADHPEVSIAFVPGGVDWAAGAAAAREVTDSGATAVLAFNDLVAIGLLSALSERGVKVPEQLSLTGFDDIQFAAYVTPALTTCRIPVDEAAARCWQMLRAQLLEPGVQADDAVLHPELIVRSSTAAAP